MDRKEDWFADDCTVLTDADVPQTDNLTEEAEEYLISIGFGGLRPCDAPPAVQATGRFIASELRGYTEARWRAEKARRELLSAERYLSECVQALSGSLALVLTGKKPGEA